MGGEPNLIDIGSCKLYPIHGAFDHSEIIESL